MRILVRADGGSNGTGHVMRCLQLASAARRAGHESVLVSRELPDALAARADAAAVARRTLPPRTSADADAVETARLARDLGADWVVVDGYAFGSAYQETIVDAGHRLLFVDDEGHAGSYAADLVLNQNFHADERFYGRRRPATRLLLGPRYALLRDEFRDPPPRSFPAEARRVLVTMGGSAPPKAVERVLDGLARTGLPLDVVVVRGPLAAEETPPAGGRLVVRYERDVRDMAAKMAWADLAVAASGTTSLELAAAGLPSISGWIADNQVSVVAAVLRLGTALDAGDLAAVDPDALASRFLSLALDPGRRRGMSEAGRALVDARGAERVVETMTEITGRT